VVYERLGRSADAAREHALVQKLHAQFDDLRNWIAEAMKKPWDAEIRLRLAKLCDELDMPEEARDWRQAAANCPPPSEVSQSKPSKDNSPK
jgi:hypothetical protein